MGQTIIGLNDPKAVKKYKGGLALDVPRESFFLKKLMGSEQIPTKPIWMRTDLEAANGEQIQFDLSMQFNMAPIEGDVEIEGKLEQLAFFSDAVYIDQMRGGADCGGAMSRKRTIHDLRATAKAQSIGWWGKAFDQIMFMYLAGARGTNDFLYPTTYTSFANNTMTAPDTNHLVYGGTATSKATVTATDTMSTLPIDRAVAYADMMGGGGAAYSAVPKVRPCNIEGEELYVMVMDPYQAFNLRRGSTTNDWADITKAMAMAMGKDNEFIKGGLGIWNGVALHKHASVIHFTDYGSGAIEASRALLLGVQAGVIAFGSPGDGLRYGWNEELKDHKNRIEISTNTKWGFKKTTFNGNDFGTMAIDTASAKP